jgi:ATP-binding cassette subfamily C protein CydC
MPADPLATRPYRVALTGGIASGKTTVANLFAAKGIPLAGEIAIDGHAASRVPLDWVRAQIALVPQDPYLFYGSIADNLRLARGSADDAELWDVLAVACLDGRVRALRHGLATWIGDTGAGLSGGERKRLGLARALLAGRPWLLLDEPAEGLDPATEAELCLRLGAWLDRRGAGLVLSSHRPRLQQLTAECVAVAPGLHNRG